VRDYLRLKLVAEPNEVFVVVFMDSLHQVLWPTSRCSEARSIRPRCTRVSSCSVLWS
jgi:hypothetical protein